MNGENDHHTGRMHQRPEDGSRGYIRIVARGCGGSVDYFGEASCDHGYTWTCEECPVLREQWKQEEVGAQPKQKEPEPLFGLFQHFASEGERQKHLKEVEEAQRNESPF
jgi:hypothetical protein